ncbi:unnamed protein product [Nezara viridula]|uniref:THAP-type domain-containing protein n=1 Tax=Nezara viridula TaxID=85310 RepID=A0A9P0H282_NEZVI|nr:unnamed protein product [Nezara viridula]
MVGCCAVGCTNSTQKGVNMKRFPSDPERRKVWSEKVDRKNWTPTDASRLCEAHFTPEMFEQNRADGQRRLRWNAIPTIFSHIPHNKSWKPTTIRYPTRTKYESKEEQSVFAVNSVSQVPDFWKNPHNANYCDEEENYVMSESTDITIKVEPGLIDDVYQHDISNDNTKDFLKGCCRIKENEDPDSVNQEEHLDSMIDIDNTIFIKQEKDEGYMNFPHEGVKIKTEPGLSEDDV